MSAGQRLAIAIGALIAFAVPVLTAFLLAQVQARQAEESRALEIARNAVVQVENSVDQLIAASRTINGLSAEEACGPAGLDIMRRIDLSSTLLQGVGWVEGEELRCSSFAGNTPYRIGPADYMSAGGAHIRGAVSIIHPESRYVVIQIGSAASILHPDLALSFIQDIPGVAVVAFSWSQRKPLLHRGSPPADVLDRELVVGATRSADGRTLAISRSNRIDVGTLVLLPPRYGVPWQPARQLVPAGILSGLIMATLFVLAARKRSSMRGMIASALSRGDFFLCYQPIVALATGKIVGVEALLRWKRPNGGEVSPDIFIPVAEQRGLMPALTECVFKLLERDLPSLLAVDPDLEVAINLAASDLHRADLIDRIGALTETAGIALSRIIIEATERSLLDPSMAGPSLASLRESGVRVAIDDFGTGYSSLAYLAVMQVDILKIDKLFIQALGTGSATSQVAQGVIEMARALDLVTIAEGVETAEQEHAVRALGVGQAQGYHYARPLALTQMADFLRARAGAARPAEPVKAGRAGAPRSKPRNRPAARH